MLWKTTKINKSNHLRQQMAYENENPTSYRLNHIKSPFCTFNNMIKQHWYYTFGDKFVFFKCLINALFSFSPHHSKFLEPCFWTQLKTTFSLILFNQKFIHLNRQLNYILLLTRKYFHNFYNTIFVPCNYHTRVYILCEIIAPTTQHKFWTLHFAREYFPNELCP